MSSEATMRHCLRPATVETPRALTEALPAAAGLDTLVAPTTVKAVPPTTAGSLEEAAASSLAAAAADSVLLEPLPGSSVMLAASKNMVEASSSRKEAVEAWPVMVNTGTEAESPNLAVNARLPFALFVKE